MITGNDRIEAKCLSHRAVFQASRLQGSQAHTAASSLACGCAWGHRQNEFPVR